MTKLYNLSVQSNHMRQWRMEFMLSVPGPFAFCVVFCGIRLLDILLETVQGKLSFWILLCLKTGLFWFYTCV